MLLSFLCPLTDMICRAFKSTSVEYKLWSSLFHLLAEMTLVAEKGIHSLHSRHSNIFQRMTPGKKDYRLLSSFLLL